MNELVNPESYILCIRYKSKNWRFVDFPGKSEALQTATREYSDFSTIDVVMLVKTDEFFQSVLDQDAARISVDLTR